MPGFKSDVMDKQMEKECGVPQILVDRIRRNMLLWICNKKPEVLKMIDK